MAVWSVVRYKNLFDQLDLAAEHYHPMKLQVLRRLEKTNGQNIQSIVRPIRNIVTPLPTDSLPIFDLGGASQHILQIDDSQSEERVSSKKVAYSGDIIISRLRSYLKQIAIVPNDINKAFLSTEFIVLRAIEKGVCVNYLLPFLLSDPVQTILSWSQDGSEHPRFKENVLFRIQIPNRVLQIRDSLNDLVYKAIHSIQRSRQLCSEAEHLLIEQLGLGELDLSLSLYHERSFSEVQKAKRFDAEFFQKKYYRLLDKINRCPFRNDPLGQIIEPIRNGYDLRDFGEEGISYIRVGDLKNGRINIEGANRVPFSWDQVTKDIRLKVGDVLMTRKGSYGNAAHVRAGQEDSLISSEIMLLRISDKNILPEYLSTFMNSIIGFTQVERYVHGVAFYSISQNDLASIRIIRAPRQVQNRVTDLVQQGDVLFKESKRLLDKAKLLVEEAIFKGAK